MNKSLLIALVSVASVGCTVAEDKAKLDTVLDNNAVALKIGFIDSFQVMRECKGGMEAGKELEYKRDELSKSIQQDEQELTQLVTDFKTKSAMMSEPAREKEQKLIVKKERDYKGKVEESEMEMKLAMQKTTEKLAHEIEAAAVSVAQREKLDAVVDTMTGRVVYAADKVNLTGTLIKEMNTKHDVQIAQNKASKKDDVKVAAKGGTTTKA